MKKKFLAPFFLYFIIFFLFCPNSLLRFSTHFFADAGDGFQNVWNLWWVNKSVCDLRTSPWFTDFLHYPYGTTLIGQTLNPFNGFAGIILQKFLSLVQTYNSIIIFSFVMGGITAFWLCLELTGSFAGSLIGGAIFTFSSYHFEHAEGHLQLVSLEWLPFFILLWIRFCENPRVRKGVFAAAALFLVILCDYYYFFYCVMTGLLFYMWHAVKKKDFLYLFRSSSIKGALAFLIPVFATSGIMVFFLIVTNHKDPLLGVHSSRENSMDLLSPFIWGSYWRFRDLVEPLWRHLTTNYNEGSVNVGITALALSLYALIKRKEIRLAHLEFWCLLGCIFAVLSLGPNLHIGGREIDTGLKFHFGGKESDILLLPYAFLWFVFPPLKFSGVPVRMMIIVQLVAAILSAGGIKAVLQSASRWKKHVIGALVIAFVIEYVPVSPSSTKPEYPDYIKTLTSLPDGAVLDLASSQCPALFYQTIHQKKMGFGYISRIPTSVEKQDLTLCNLIIAGDWSRLANDFHFRYIIKGGRLPDIREPGLVQGMPLKEIDSTKRIYRHNGVSIYRF